MAEIKLRALEPSDVDLIFSWENDQEVWKVSHTITPFSKHVIQQYVDNSYRDIFETKQLRLMIDATEEGVVSTVGTIDLFEYDPYNSRAGVGILIKNPEDRKKGYARQALLMFMEYAFSTLLLHQLYCNISASNKGSIQLFESAGFQQIGLKKEWNRNEHGFEDELIYQFIAAL